MRAETLQTMRVIVSLILRVLLFGIALPVLLRHFPDYKLPYRFPTEWIVVVVCDTLAVVAPLMRTRKLAFLAGAAALGAHYYYHHFVPLWDLAYMGVAIIFVLLPGSGRTTAKEGPRTR
jgi:hypothetical protein